MFLCESSGNPKLMEPSLTPLVLFPDPSAFDKIPLAGLNATAVGVVEMGLPPQDFLVGVSAGMCDDAGCQKDGGKSLRKLNHVDCKH